MTAHVGLESTAPRILNHGNRRKWIVALRFRCCTSRKTASPALLPPHSRYEGYRKLIWPQSVCLSGIELKICVYLTGIELQIYIYLSGIVLNIITHPTSSLVTIVTELCIFSYDCRNGLSNSFINWFVCVLKTASAGCDVGAVVSAFADLNVKLYCVFQNY